MYLKMAFRNVFRNPTRTFITLLAIAAGCISLILASGFIEDTTRQVREQYIRDFLGHLRIYRHGFLQDGVLHPFDYLITNPADLCQTIRAQAHVRAAGPRLNCAGLISNGDATLPFMMQSYDLASEETAKNTTVIRTGTFLEQGQNYDILIGDGLAKALSTKAGDSLVLVANTPHGAMNAMDTNIRGVFGSVSKDFDDHGVRAPIQLAQKLLHSTGAQMIVVFLDRTENTESVRKNLLRVLNNKILEYDIQSWDEMEEAQQVRQISQVYNAIYRVARLIIFVVVILGIMNTMNMAVLERTGEIGTLMAMGTSRGDVLRLFITEGLALGLLGAVIGCIMGAFLGVFISWLGIPMPTPPGTTVSWVARIALPAEVFVAPLEMTIVTALLSSLFPAWKASRLEVAEALRHNV